MTRPRVRYGTQTPSETRPYGITLTDQQIQVSTALLTDPDGTNIAPPLVVETLPSYTSTYLAGPLTKTGVWKFTIRNTLADGQMVESIWRITSHEYNP